MEKYIETTNVLQYLERAVEYNPDKLAYQDENESVTFIEYMEAGMRIGSALKKYGLHKAPIAILMDARHITNLKVTIGIQYGGCFYIPLDPTAPTERIQIIFSKLNPALVIYDEKGEVHKDALGDKYNFVDFTTLLDAPIDMEFLEQVRKESNIYDILFIMYTSGSTGIPKGAVHTQSDLIRYVEITVPNYPFDENTIFGNQSPFFYANCIHEVYLPLKTVSTTYLLPPYILSFPKKLVEFLNEHKICSLLMTPSAFNAVAEAGALEPGCLPYLGFILPIGEKANGKYMKMWEEAAPNGHFWNFYGSTELLTVATSPVTGLYTGAGDEVIPSGVPYRIVHVLIIDDEGNECPKGTTGEIYVNSSFRFSGYYKDPERTKEILITDPLNKGWTETFFRTGDNGFIDENDMLVVIGRRDNMIKHKGYRMELGEVEYAGTGTEGVSACCCVLDKSVDAGDIFLFYTGSIEEKDLRSALKQILPKFAMPEHIIHLEEMPYTSNMKADRLTLSKMIPQYK